MIRSVTHHIPARDAYPLALRLVEPSQVRARATLVIGSATAVQQRFYEKFANYLAKHQYRVVTFDYRGIGNSRHADWQGAAPTMMDWGCLDLSAVLDWAAEQGTGEPLLYLGHSVGGQLLGLTDNHQKVRASLMVAAQNGYWKHWPGMLRWRRWVDWHLLMPAMTRVYGRLPGFFMGGEDLPKSIAEEWSRWCRHPEFIHQSDGQVLRERFARVRMPIQFWYFSDDADLAPEAAVKALRAFYQGAQTSLRKVHPKEAGVRKLGHFGFFKGNLNSALWETAESWLAQYALPVSNVKEAQVQLAHAGMLG